MRIEYLQVSNILSFPYAPDIAEAEKITFDDGLNIIIGENGSGKSTALEIINFLFKRVFYRQFFSTEIFLGDGRPCRLLIVRISCSTSISAT